MEDGKVMSLLEHLSELRMRLFRCLLAILIGTGVAWHFAPDFLNFVERPLTGHTYLTVLREDVYGALKQRFPELYNRYKLGEASRLNPENRKLNYTAPLEPFFVQVKLSMIIGCMLALPVVLYEIWMFIAPGLTRGERRMAFPFVAVGTLSFFIGACFFLLFIWPVIINFSLSYQSAGLRSWLSLSAYINFCLRLILIFGLVFELPIVSILLARLGLVSSRFLARQRKFAVLASAIIAAFHADLLTMVVVWLPLYLMYEVSIWMARIFGRRKQAVEAPAPA